MIDIGMDTMEQFKPTEPIGLKTYLGKHASKFPQLLDAKDIIAYQTNKEANVLVPDRPLPKLPKYEKSDKQKFNLSAGMYNFIHQLLP
jgi:hypothetical protein